MVRLRFTSMPAIGCLVRTRTEGIPPAERGGLLSYDLQGRAMDPITSFLSFSVLSCFLYCATI